MKNTSAERLSKALISLQHRINEYCEMHKESTLKMGMCLVNPKRAFLKPPTKEIQEKLEQNYVSRKLLRSFVTTA